MLHFGRWKLISIFAVILLGVLYTVPNFVPETDRYTVNELDGTREAQGIWRWLPSRSSSSATR